MVEKGGTDDALCDIIGHAHPAVRTQSVKEMSESFCAVIAVKDAADKDEHERYLIQRCKDEFQRCKYSGTFNVVAYHVGEAIQGEETAE